MLLFLQPPPIPEKSLIRRLARRGGFDFRLDNLQTIRKSSTKLSHSQSLFNVYFRPAQVYGVISNSVHATQGAANIIVQHPPFDQITDEAPHLGMR
ncbi:hypothetical protein HMPREF2684_26545 [Pseudomonas aeruginosa]|nr:hypothetical protein HMPREF2684_26545 [Pseudomonas aeruginosa]